MGTGPREAESASRCSGPSCPQIPGHCAAARKACRLAVKLPAWQDPFSSRTTRYCFSLFLPLFVRGMVTIDFSGLRTLELDAADRVVFLWLRADGLDPHVLDFGISAAIP